jgi:hypothetical protein
MRATRSPRYAKAANTTLHGYFENTDHDEGKLPERRNSFDKSTILYDSNKQLDLYISTS